LVQHHGPVLVGDNGSYLLEVVRDQGLGGVNHALDSGTAHTHSGFGMIQSDTACKTALCEQAKLRDDQLVELSKGG
jgi:hypothetical protein